MDASRSGEQKLKSSTRHFEATNLFDTIIMATGPLCICQNPYNCTAHKVQLVNLNVNYGLSLIMHQY